MLETLANLGEFLGGVAVVLSLLYVAFQLHQTRKQMKANAMQDRITLRINTWSNQLDLEALASAHDKIFEHELYRRDLLLHEIEELSLRERRALSAELRIELVYFQNLFYQRQNHIMDRNQSLPLDYMMCFNTAPLRRHWKDSLRLFGHFPNDYIAHVDGIVKKYDEVERRLSDDENMEFDPVFLEIFDVPPPPRWIEH